MNTILCELNDPGISGLESYSPFCLKVHRALRLQDVPYERRHGKMPSEFSHINPLGQVPVLLVDDVPICDSTEILQFLNVEGNGEAKLWEELADTTLNGFLVAARWADDENWPATKSEYFGAMPAPLRAFLPARIRQGIIKNLKARGTWLGGAKACWAHFEKILDALEERAPSEEYWLGDTISVADLGLFAQLHSLRQDITPRQKTSIAARSQLSAYLDRVDHATQ